MTLLKIIRPLVLATLTLAAGTASAHPGHGAGFVGGLVHPLFGLDHLLAMVAIGLWAAQQGGRALWAVPASFVATMLAGGALAWSGWMLPHLETGIALSVLVLGLLIATQRRWGVPAGMAVAAVFALFHGYAHGLDMPPTASPLGYAIGFVLATAALHGVGLAGGLLGRRLVRLAGWGIAASGVALALGL